MKLSPEKKTSVFVSWLDLPLGSPFLFPPLFFFFFQIYLFIFSSSSGHTICGACVHSCSLWLFDTQTQPPDLNLYSREILISIRFSPFNEGRKETKIKTMDKAISTTTIQFNCRVSPHNVMSPSFPPTTTTSPRNSARNEEIQSN